tara:strand:- start:334 stop:438 length:105 start_codon:yes stop_codon:yes gene_type:complete
MSLGPLLLHRFLDLRAMLFLPHHYFFRRRRLILL